MATFDNRLAKAGNFTTHRSLIGAAATDSTTYNDSNFPPTSAFHTISSLTMFVTWNGTGGTNADTIDIEPLMRNDIDGEWIRMAVVQIKKQSLAEVRVAGAGLIFLRINAVSTTATDLKIKAAMGEIEVGL